MVDRRFRDSGWGQPPAIHSPATAAPSPSGKGEMPASPSIASSGPEIDPVGPSGAAHPPAQIAQDGWGRPPAPVGTSQPPAGRNAKGQFVTGSNGGPGRKKGSRNRLTTLFVSKVLEHFERHGDQVLDKLKDEYPAEYARLVRSLILAQDPIPEFESFDEAMEYLEDMRQQREIEIAAEQIQQY